MSLLYDKVGRSANNFRKSRIHKFADLNNLQDLRTFRKCDSSQICDYRYTIFFAICKTSASPQKHIISLCKYSR
jgi:hypothetical protein